MSRNETLFARAQRTIPAGVNSPVRAFRSVGGTPRFLMRGEGPYVWDADGKRYIDYVGSWGPAIVGHAHPDVVRAVQEAAVHGLSFGAPTEIEIEMAETLVRRLPSLELVRLVSSGTEATMSALRLARGLHGPQQDHEVRRLLPRPRRQPAREGRFRRADVRAAFVRRRAAVDRGRDHRCAVQRSRRRRGGVSRGAATQIAGIIVEPIAGNMNLVKPAPGFLEGLAIAAATATAPC